ncbi:hypothetical protein GLOIN_2v1792247 [Rhizophagus irregularis DAOM 181602=DAOM 197198]|nr:hypothetical protein GLOIN_2v1792247 [Rhizophagus irregularis DAOM 181602=DAOM 197198]
MNYCHGHQQHLVQVLDCPVLSHPRTCPSPSHNTVLRYSEEDLVKILKDSGYHSEEWEETDPEENWPVIQPDIVEDNALLRLLHDRIDPTIKLLKKKSPTLKRKRAQLRYNTSSIPPIGAPSWCLNQEALKQFNRSSINIPVYDYDIDDIQNNSDNDTEDESINNEEIPNRTNSNKRKKKKTKKQKRSKKHKSK